MDHLYDPLMVSRLKQSLYVFISTLKTELKKTNIRTRAVPVSGISELKFIFLRHFWGIWCARTQMWSVTTNQKDWASQSRYSVGAAGSCAVDQCEQSILCECVSASLLPSSLLVSNIKRHLTLLFPSCQLAVWRYSSTCSTCSTSPSGALPPLLFLPCFYPWAGSVWNIIHCFPRLLTCSQRACTLSK